VDAAFPDLRMPGILGIEFLHEAKPIVPVIVLTAFADSSNTIEAMRLGAFDHLTKPIGRSDLQRVLAEALKNRKSLQEAIYPLPAMAWSDSALVCARFKNGSGSPPAGRSRAKQEPAKNCEGVEYSKRSDHTPQATLEATSIGPSADHLQTVTAIDDRPRGGPGERPRPIPAPAGIS
jgi:DNA-binding response OmpR family regulator